MSKELPIFYRNVEFITVNGNKHVGYLEPPFTDKDNSFFVVPMLSEKKQGYDALFYHPDDVSSWKYV